MKKAREEDMNLAFEQFPDMNRKFYSAEWGPAQYLSMRMRSLLLGSSNSPLVIEAAAEGFSIGDVKVAYKGNEEWSESTGSDFLVTESSVLLHHAGETLLRLYFAHSNQPPCPWLETARLRSFVDFKERVAALGASLSSPDVQSSIMDVFVGMPSLEEKSKEISDEAWVSQRDGLLLLLGETVRVLLGDSNMYNSAKHGLSLFPNEVGISFAFPEDAPDIDLSMDGKALQYLQVSESRTGKRWEERSAWVYPEANLSMVFLMVKQIESMMNVATARYVGMTEDGFTVHPITTEMVETASRVGMPKRTYMMQSFSQQLLYYRQDDGLAPVEEPIGSLAADEEN